MEIRSLEVVNRDDERSPTGECFEVIVNNENDNYFETIEEVSQYLARIGWRGTATIGKYETGKRGWVDATGWSWLLARPAPPRPTRPAQPGKPAARDWGVMKTRIVRFVTNAQWGPLSGGLVARAFDYQSDHQAAAQSVARRIRASDIIGGNFDGPWFRATYVTPSGRHEIGVMVD